MATVDRVNAGLRKVPAWVLYLVGPLPALWLFWLATTGGLGADPVKALEHEIGKIGLQLLVAVLCVTPLRRHAGLNLMKFRRAIGLLAFFYVVLHFLAWLVLDMGLLWAQAAGDIVKRPYITIGMAGLVMLIPLAATSNDWAMRELGGARWRKLHRLTYLAVLAGAIHYVWLVKAWPVEPFLYLAAVVALLALRTIQRGRRVAA
ncbi:protein-methionine-sulfoxide reductase heme-binding subunit MsrQ [Ostreiculturibacter nitratireducens]|uniref:protein-methionine-sulfoxide reductase heme-binding subunit MsrQ n=1 Tax=Ostreiculturibacter nitratireducens TaxID=3075226 RepID=UPI0031B5A070